MRWRICSEEQQCDHQRMGQDNTPRAESGESTVSRWELVSLEDPPFLFFPRGSYGTTISIAYVWRFEARHVTTRDTNSATFIFWQRSNQSQTGLSTRPSACLSDAIILGIACLCARGSRSSCKSLIAYLVVSWGRLFNWVAEDPCGRIKKQTDNLATCWIMLVMRYVRCCLKMSRVRT